MLWRTIITGLLLATANVAAAFDTTSLVSVWALNEASGNATDSFGSNTLTDTNTVARVAGKVSNCGDFEDANTEYFTVADNTSLSMGHVDMTLTYWVQFESLGTNRDCVSKWGGSASTQEYLSGYVSSSNRLRFLVNNTAGTTNTSVLANTFGAVSTGTWYFVVCYHDDTVGEIAISVNNGAFDTASTSGGIRDSTTNFQLGARPGPSTYHDGLIDEVTLWKRKLTAGEITTLYNGGAGLAYPWASGTVSKILQLSDLRLREPRPCDILLVR